MIKVGPTGAVVEGSVLDANKRDLQRALQDYDSQLYLKWNAQKKRGQGTWELRRRPEKKVIVQAIPFEGNTYCVVDYKENNWEHHVYDIDVLGYDLLKRIKENDLFVASNYEGKAHRLSQYLQRTDDENYRRIDELEEKARKERLYNLMQDKHILQDFQEKILSGVNPAHLLRYWNK